MIFMSGLHADTTADTARYGRLHEQNVPFVLVNGCSPAISAPFVSCDDRSAMDLAVTHLRALATPASDWPSGLFVPVQRKIEGFLGAVRRRLGQPAEEARQRIRHTLFTLEGGQAAAAELLDLAVRPSCAPAT
jgi:DNA-binding LacI/PurR family transcriptional regulator